MIENYNIIIFSSDDWNCGLKTSKYHIAIRLSRKNRVLFVNSIGLRNPTLKSNDMFRIFNKVFEWFRGPKKESPNLFVYSPIVLPFHSLKVAQIVNRFILRFSLNLVRIKLNMQKPLILIFTPNFYDVLGYLNESAIIYYCIDELAGTKDIDVSLLISKEKALLRKADCVIVCSKVLESIKSLLHPRVYYVPHGVNWELFRKGLEDNLHVPSDIKDIKSPIIGFYGFITHWVDLDLIKFVALSHPEWSIVLIGPSLLDIKSLLKTKNIHYLGPKAFESLPYYTSKFDVATIPFKINEITLNSNPLKALEYLASGRPVVSTKIPELKNFGNMVYIADTYKEFVECIERSLLENSSEKIYERSEAVKNESWDSRIELISRIIQNVTSKKRINTDER